MVEGPGWSRQVPWEPKDVLVGELGGSGGRVLTRTRSACELMVMSRWERGRGRRGTDARARAGTGNRKQDKAKVEVNRMAEQQSMDGTCRVSRPLLAAVAGPLGLALGLLSADAPLTSGGNLKRGPRQSAVQTSTGGSATVLSGWLSWKVIISTRRSQGGKDWMATSVVLIGQFPVPLAALTRPGNRG